MSYLHDTYQEKTIQPEFKNLSSDQFVTHVNQLRKDNKNNWYWFTGKVNNKNVRLKGYNTWLQIFEIEGLRLSCGMDVSVKEFKQSLEKGVK